MSDYTPKISQSKVEAVGALVEEFKDVKDFIFTNYRGLTVEQITDVRNKLREQNASFRVVKNRFAKIALKQLDRPEVFESLIGPTAVVLAYDESGPVAKTLVEFAKDTPLELKGGIIDGGVFDEKQVEAYSKLPTKLELIASLMGTMNAPLQQFVGILNEIPTKLVRTLKAYEEKLNS